MNTAFQIFNVVTKNRCHLSRRSFKKSQKYLYNGKNLKKNFLQLRFSNVLLHLEYKLLLCEPKIEFKKLPGEEALATEGQSKQFVPSLFLSNVISLSPKMDELSHVVQNANYDLVCKTETWL